MHFSPSLVASPSLLGAYSFWAINCHLFLECFSYPRIESSGIALFDPKCAKCLLCSLINVIS
ncbi:hypothetical protein CW304_21045 [Bacillus sp. UFRGS-B20]|nr:hypothetical protein CW304_21045 [Bacillus sp. UFRGS-B20]